MATCREVRVFFLQSGRRSVFHIMVPAKHAGMTLYFAGLTEAGERRLTDDRFKAARYTTYLEAEWAMVTLGMFDCSVLERVLKGDEQ